MMPIKLAESIVLLNPDLEVTAEKVQQIGEAVFHYIIDQTKNNVKVNLPNFLKFERVKRAERTFKNPNNKTNEPGSSVVKPERYALSVSVMGSVKKLFEELEVTGDPNEVKATKPVEEDANESKVAAEKKKKPVAKKAKSVEKDKELASESYKIDPLTQE